MPEPPEVNLPATHCPEPHHLADASQVREGGGGGGGGGHDGVSGGASGTAGAGGGGMGGDDTVTGVDIVRLQVSLATDAGEVGADGGELGGKGGRAGAGSYSPTAAIAAGTRTRAEMRTDVG